MKRHLTNTKLTINRLIITSSFLASLLFSCSTDHNKLIIATAANTQFALSKIVADFRADTGIDVELVISSSGKHTAQIIAGAPYDIFISADMKYPEKLFDAKLTTEAPTVYAYGQLVLWSYSETAELNISDLDKKSFNHIAIPNPETAPYGVIARQALLELNLWDKLEPWFVYGESVAQTNQYIVSGAADVGFTAASIVMAPKNLGLGHWAYVPDSLYTPMAQGVVILKKSTRLDLAEKFYQYLLSDKSTEILASYGYRTMTEE